MKIWENKSRTGIVALVLAAMVAVLIYSLLGSSGPAAKSAAPPEESAAHGKAQRAPLLNTLDPSIRLDLLRASERVDYKGSGRNIFKDAPPPPPPPQPVAPAFIGPPKAPPPPPINLKFYGFASEQGGTRKVFLSENGDIFIAQQGDIVDRRYKVVQIGPTSVQIEDVLENNTQTIPLTEGPTGSGGPS